MIRTPDIRSKIRISGYPVFGYPDIRKSGYSKIRNPDFLILSGYPKFGYSDIIRIPDICNPDIRIFIRISGYSKFRYPDNDPDISRSGYPKFKYPDFLSGYQDIRNSDIRILIRIFHDPDRDPIS
ncbi:MAG: hypothetical protein ACHQ1D_09770, partial [Nitrososphaerales archaeon]